MYELDEGGLQITNYKLQTFFLYELVLVLVRRTSIYLDYFLTSGVQASSDYLEMTVYSVHNIPDKFYTVHGSIFSLTASSLAKHCGSIRATDFKRHGWFCNLSLDSHMFVLLFYVYCAHGCRASFTTE